LLIVREVNKPWLHGFVKRITVSASGDGLGVSSFSSSSSLASASVFYTKKNQKKNFSIGISSYSTNTENIAQTFPNNIGNN